MRPILITLLLLSSVILPSGVFAQESTQEVSSTNPFYFLTEIYEEISLLFTFNEERRMEKRLEFAEKRLQEMERIGENIPPEAMERIQNRYEKHMEKALEIAQKREEKLQERLQRIQQARERHMFVLEDVYDKVPEEAKEGIESAIENSLSRYDEIEEGIEQNTVLPADREEVRQQMMEMRQRIENRKLGR